LVENETTDIKKDDEFEAHHDGEHVSGATADHEDTSTISTKEVDIKGEHPDGENNSTSEHDDAGPVSSKEDNAP